MIRKKIDFFESSGMLRIRQTDREKIKSLITSAKINADVVKKIKVDELSSTVIFREIYESIRQLGDV